MSREWKQIETPFSEGLVSGLRSGDLVLITGRLYTARDRAHERLCSMIDLGEPLPFDAEGQVLYYVGPTPAPKGRVIGSAGPTTSYRMDAFTDKILGAGIRGMIGKGRRDSDTKKLLQSYGAVYLSSFGGAGAYLSGRIISSRIIAFEDLGPEAIYELEVADFPAVVVHDRFGGALYEDAIRKR